MRKWGKKGRGGKGRFNKIQLHRVFGFSIPLPIAVPVPILVPVPVPVICFICLYSG